MISVYCDGSSSGGSFKPGGYGWLIVRNDEVIAWGYGGSPVTSNNKQELEGAIQGLTALIHLGLQVGDAVELVSDSQYVLGIVNGAYHPTTNLEQTRSLRDLAARVNGLRCRWVKGHSGEKWNEKVDELAGLGKYEYLPRELREPKARKNARRERRTAARLARAEVSNVPTGSGEIE